MTNEISYRQLKIEQHKPTKYEKEGKTRVPLKIASAHGYPTNYIMKMGGLISGNIADLNMVILSSNIIWMQTNMKFNNNITAVLMDNIFTIINQDARFHARYHCIYNLAIIHQLHVNWV